MCICTFQSVQTTQICNVSIASPMPTFKASSDHNKPLLRGLSVAAMAPSALQSQKLRRWQRRLPLDPGRSAPEAEVSWLNCKGGLLGCVACNAARKCNNNLCGDDDGPGDDATRRLATCTVPFATAQLSHLRRHANLSSHKRAVNRLLGKEVPTDNDDDEDLAPSADAFKRAWDAICAGLAPNAGVPGVGCRKKVVQMVKCLAEGVRMIDREWIVKAKSMAVVRDERDSRLVVRFSLTTGELECRQGILGQARHFGSGAEAITEATGQIIKEFAATKCPDGPVPELLEAHIRNTIHQLAVDAASDETLSGRMMQRGTNLDGERPLTPNLVLITRDKAHGSRRTGLSMQLVPAKMLACSSQLN